MKTLSLSHFTMIASVFLLISLNSCSADLATPVQDQLDKKEITVRTDFSGYEEQVKEKVAERDNISVSSITNCYYYGLTQEGYGRYHFSTSLGFGIYTVTGIIGDDVEGW